MRKTKNISTETATIVEVLEAMSAARRKYFVERLLEIVNEEIAEQKWDATLNFNPNPMLKIAEQAIKEHRKGKSKPLFL
ncbi:MAG: hypothetical protein HKL88_09020 [Bacteroidia bacterium]|nr:hypothetical protein [Bacteroidia bacterium]